MRSILAITFAAGLLTCPSLSEAETVYVQYRGEVDLASFNCRDVSRSSFINRVCYDQRNAYMLISLNGKYYHYCGIDAGTVSSLAAAPSMGVFYNTSIKGNFDCRVGGAPEYPTVAPSSPSKACAVELLGICASYYTQKEEAEREKLAALEAELDLRKHVHYSNGKITIYHGIFSTTFPAETTDLEITCSYDDGMKVVFKNDDRSASVRMPMDEIVCSGIANSLGKTAGRVMRGE